MRKYMPTGRAFHNYGQGDAYGGISDVCDMPFVCVFDVAENDFVHIYFLGFFSLCLPWHEHQQA